MYMFLGVLRFILIEKIMEIQTLSIVVGNAACNADCAYCISKMTGLQEVKKELPINFPWRNFNIALNYAKNAGVSTILFTGKGGAYSFSHKYY